MKITQYADEEMAIEIRAAIKTADGHCPCVLPQCRTADTKCMCKEFRDAPVDSICNCGLYIKTND